MREQYTSIMDSNKNPLKHLPQVQRFQLMVLLSIMWSTVFSIAIGSWFWWGELVVGHVAVAVGIILTSLTFGSAKQKTHRDHYKSKDGSTRYDDIWGG
ncbi:MAG: hypothetical protein CMM44_09605 [Rhodospirillaceae bacterium]|nr:hypothetical protein [Rhodospirillaceae bacterium]